jgi:xylulose-5-phosphate/fructose-6-phosphate phosphoketolase
VAGYEESANQYLKTLNQDLLHKMDAYWRAANYLAVGQIYLYDNPLLKRPLTIADVKHMPVVPWFDSGLCRYSK